MKKPNQLKKLLVNDEKEFLLYLSEWEMEILPCALDVYKKLLQQKLFQTEGKFKEEDSIKRIEKLEQKLDISFGQTI